MKLLSIIIPAYNEEKTIASVLDKVLAQNYGEWEKEIIVVNDCSSDKTEEIIQPYLDKIKYIKHSKNSGKGTAIKTGLSESSGDAVIVQDADLEYNPDDIKLLLEKFDSGFEIVYGSRNLHPERRGYSHYVLGSKILDWLVNLFFWTNLTDVYTCYKLFKTDILRKIGIESKGFEMEMELTAKALKMGYKIIEVPIHYYPRKFSEGKKIRARDGIKGIWTLLKYRF
jgi:dolichol-phosphate mannosyltransferase